MPITWCVRPVNGAGGGRVLLAMMRHLVLLLTFIPLLVAHPGWGLVVTDAGDLWFTDVIQNRILRVDAQGRLHVVRTGLHSHWLWLAPDGAIHGEHLWYDQARDEFPSYSWRITPRGVFEKLKQEADRAPRDSAGRRYVAKADRVERLSPDGSVTVLGGVPFAGAARGKYERLMGLTLDGQDNVFVADIEHGVVRRISPEGRVVDHWTSAFNWSPWGVFWKEGALYVLEHAKYPGTGLRIVKVMQARRGALIFSLS